MSIYNDIKNEYDLFLALEKQQELLYQQSRDFYDIGDKINGNRLREEKNSLQENKIEHLRNAADLSENIYVSRVCAGESYVAFEVHNYFIEKREEFHKSFPYDLSYRIEVNIPKEGAFQYKKYFQLTQGGHEEMVAQAVSPISNKINDVNDKSNSEVETLSNFALRNAESFSKNILHILKENKREELKSTLEKNNNLQQFQNGLNDLLTEMSDILSVKDRDRVASLDTMARFSDNTKNYVLNRLEKLNNNNYKAVTERELKWQESTIAPKRKF